MAALRRNSGAVAALCRGTARGEEARAKQAHHKGSGMHVLWGLGGGAVLWRTRQGGDGGAAVFCLETEEEEEDGTDGWDLHVSEGVGGKKLTGGARLSARERGRAGG